MPQNEVRPIRLAMPGERVHIEGPGQLNALLRPVKARIEIGRLDHIVAIKRLPLMHLVIERDKPPAQFRNISQLEVFALDKNGVVLLLERTAFLELSLVRREWIDPLQRRIREERWLHIPAHLLIGWERDLSLRHRDGSSLRGLPGSLRPATQRRS